MAAGLLLPPKTPLRTPELKAPTRPIPEQKSVAQPVADQDPPKPKTSARCPYRRFFFDALHGAIVVLLLHVFVLQVSVVRGHSMEPCLNDGDRLVVDRIASDLTGLSRFDVVILRCPTAPDVDYVKRVLALPGERVAIRQGRVFVNGSIVDDDLVVVRDDAEMQEQVVLDSHFFVLGDNRAVSSDSRDFGLVPAENLRGKVRLRFWPLQRLELF